MEGSECGVGRPIQRLVQVPMTEMEEESFTR